jgi:hypothetical protein
MARLYVCAVFVILVSAVMSRAQTAPNVSIDPASMGGRVYLVAFDTVSAGGFARVFEAATHKDARPLAVVLVNNTNQNIIAMTIRWTLKSGEHVNYFKSGADSLNLGSLGMSGANAKSRPEQGDADAPREIGRTFGAMRAPVAPGERLLAAPGLILPESVAAGRKPSGGFASFPDALLTADAVTVSLDAVVLDDGELMGANPQELVATLKANKRVADSIVAKVRTAEANGEDGSALLARMARQTPGSRPSGQEMQERLLARRLLMSREWKAEIEKLASIRLPNFHQQ